MDVNSISNSITGDTFTCGQCKTIFECLNVYLEHKKVSCYSETNKVQKVTGNIETCNNETKSTCQKVFKKCKSLESDKKAHREKTYQCPLCGRCFGQSSHLQNHLQSHRIWPDGLNDTTSKTTSAELLSYTCPYCDINLTNYNQFRGHLKCHLELKKYKCVQNNCSELFDNIELLLKHVSNSHTLTSYNCHLCSKDFSSLTDIAIHQQQHEKIIHKDKKKYKCKQCDAIYVKKSTLVMHLATAAHNNTCIHCKKGFTSDKRLRLHLQIHNNNKPFSCEICGETFRLKKYLNSHKLKHGESIYSCNICNMRFKRKDILNRHMKMHLNNKKLQCPFKDKLGCAVEFTRKDKLNQHIKYHTNKMTIIPKKERKKKKNEGSTLEILIVPVNEN